MTASDTALEIADLVLRLGRVDRITQHPDGRPESDTDHTCMLALLAGELCPARLSRAEVLAFALVHDLVEAHAGDTPTLRLPTADQAAAKDAREAAALARIAAALGEQSWIVRTIREYEFQRCAEARWVKALDKCAPKLTHLLNDSRAIAAQGVSYPEVIARVEGQIERIGADLPEARQLARDLLDRMIRSWEPRP